MQGLKDKHGASGRTTTVDEDRMVESHIKVISAKIENQKIKKQSSTKLVPAENTPCEGQ